MRWNLVSLFVAATLALAAPARADTVKLTNGDELTGKVVALGGGTLTFKSDAVGELKIDVAKVDTIVTDEAIDVELADGTKLHGKAEAGKSGNFVLNVGSSSNPEVAFANVAAVNKPPRAWTGSVIGSGTWSKGNTEATTVAVDAHAENRGDKDRITSDAWYRGTRTKDQTTGDTSTDERRLGASAKYDYFISGEKIYAYVNAFGEKSASNNIDLRFIAGAGGGYQFIETERTKLAGEAGISWIYTNYSDGSSTERDPALRVAGRFNHEFNSVLSFFDDAVILKVLTGDDYLLRNRGGFREKISDSLFAQQWVEHTIDSDPAGNTERLDVIYYFGVGWTF